LKIQPVSSVDHYRVGHFLIILKRKLLIPNLSSMSSTMSYTSMLLVMIFFLINCSGDSRRSHIDAVEQEVMEVHNHVMPLMGEVARLKDELEKSKENLDSLAIEQAEAIDILLLELSAANEGMMDWMRSYSGDFSKMEQEEIEKYLNEQKKEIKKVEARITRAIEAAKSELGK